MESEKGEEKRKGGKKNNSKRVEGYPNSVGIEPWIELSDISLIILVEKGRNKYFFFFFFFFFLKKKEMQSKSFQKKRKYKQNCHSIKTIDFNRKISIQRIEPQIPGWK